MTLFDALAILTLVCAMESRNCSKRADIWDAICELDGRKRDKPKDNQPTLSETTTHCDDLYFAQKAREAMTRGNFAGKRESMRFLKKITAHYEGE